MESGGVVVDGDFLYYMNARIAGEMSDVLVSSGVVKEGLNSEIVNNTLIL